jgi:hypothetical protein
MAKARTQRLKVYCTPIGFHDAYVAAPSQKAALEAWGAKTNLFAQGAAQLVSDRKPTKVPLDRPGEVIKVLRGSDAEQLAALDRSPSPGKAGAKTRAEPTAKPGIKPKRHRSKPGRSKLTRAEEALGKLEASQVKEMQKIEDEERELKRKRRELEQRHSAAAAAARARIDQERDRYKSALRDWTAD